MNLAPDLHWILPISESDCQIAKVPTIFDTALTKLQPDYKTLTIGDFDLYCSAFFTYISFFWKNIQLDTNRIKKTFHLHIPRFENDLISCSEFATTGNKFDLEMFHILINEYFMLYNTGLGMALRTLFRQMNHTLRNAKTQADVNGIMPYVVVKNNLHYICKQLYEQRDKTILYNGSSDGFMYENDLNILKSLLRLLDDGLYVSLV